ncbi:3-hydroxypropionyl-coenzyme A dehydratase 1 [Colletotrichum chlorophyti]|uniref:3-hydroxypropionyl-coenzyme A dehydratase 1 n=1 Tax=Colletotrichum chlorophyti TaxID=708187 RepID=A0A1Q8RJB1_9PEZI|nr:3-hydroxypropionyl-coenzyme A dehydratase 1 [Colletotrichum chlorophyti]
MASSFSYSSHPWRNIRVEGPNTSGVAVVFLDRANERNALTVPMLEDMIKLFSLMDQDAGVKSIVVTGDGPMFCSGVDLKQGFGKIGKTPETHRDAGGQLALAIHRCRKPMIAAINGPAIGVGITMTLPMTIRVTSKASKVSFAFVRLGIVADASSSFYLPRLIGHSRALHLFTTGGTFPATSPLLHDLFSEVTDSPAQVLPRAMQIATDIAVNTSQVSTYLTRELVWRGPASPEEAHLLESAVMHRCFHSNDFKEAGKAFKEKRKPEFKDTLCNATPAFVPWWLDHPLLERPVQAKL